jgi:hypothetical protein
MGIATDDVVTWGGAILLMGGMLIGFVGAMGYKLARLARYDTPNVRPGRWVVVALIGLAMMTAGWGVWKVFGRARSVHPDVSPERELDSE